MKIKKARWTKPTFRHPWPIRIAVSLVALACASFCVDAPAWAEHADSPPTYIDMRAFGFGDANIFDSQKPLTDEEFDKKGQADWLEKLTGTGITYHPDPDLTKKVSRLQKEWDEANFDETCGAKLILREDLPQEAYVAAYKQEMKNSRFAKTLDRLKRIFPDDRDYLVSMTHLNRVHERIYGPNGYDDRDSYCEKNKAHFNSVVSARPVLGCPTPEILESIVSVRVHRDLSEAMNVAVSRRCKLFPAGQKASIEEKKWFNGYIVFRIRPNGDAVDYWTEDRNTF